MEYAVPSIRAEDYPAFRDLPGSDLPDSYDAWLRFVADQQIGVRDKDGAVVPIEVYPAELAEFCAEHGGPSDTDALLRYVAEKQRRMADV